MDSKTVPTSASAHAGRSAVFISHANAEDNVFTIWLGAKLTALGYDVWADVLRLRGGQDWQRLLEDALRNKACKVLLVGTPAAVDKQGVRNEIQIAHDVAKTIGDKEFIIPLRLQQFDAPFLIAHAQYIEFSKSWSAGLAELLETLEQTYRVPRGTGASDDRWKEIQTIHATSLQPIQETLTSNWAATTEWPHEVRYFEFSRTANVSDLEARLTGSTIPAIRFENGILSFATIADLLQPFGLDAVTLKARVSVDSYIAEGWPAFGVDARTAQRHLSDLTRQGLENFFHKRGLNGYEMSQGRFAWWPPIGVTSPGKVQFRWGSTSGTRKIQGASLKKGFHWHFGVTANTRLWPVRHVRFTSRLVFTEDGTKTMDAKRMHKIRRSFAKSWRNPRWRDMLLAFLSWLSGGGDLLVVQMGSDQRMIVSLPPLKFSAPVGIPHHLNEAETDDDEELDKEADEASSEEDEEFSPDEEL